MKNITIYRASKFINLKNNPFKIFDERMNHIYTVDIDQGFFYMPAGDYFTDNPGDIGILTKYMAPYVLPAYSVGNEVTPYAQIRLMRDGKKLLIPEVSVNPDFWSKLNKCQRDFVLFHELGHTIHNSQSAGHKYNPFSSQKLIEKKCDWFAAKAMVKKGYNPSQVYAASDTLGAFDKERREVVGQKILNMYSG